MATARKDVELVIRARDQATKAVDTIAKAFETLTGEQEDLAKSGAGVDNTLGRLGQALTKLDSVFKGLSVGDSLSKQFERAQAESDRLQQAMVETAAESQRLAAELERAGQSAAELNTKMAQAGAAVAKQGEAAKKAKADQRELNRTLNESVAERDKLVKAEARLTNSLAQQPAKVDKARERFERLSRELEGMVKPTETFQARFEASVRSLAKAEGKMAGLQQELELTKTAIIGANTGIDALTAQLEQAGSTVTETAAKLATAKSEYKELGVAAKAAASDQKALTRAQEDIAETLARVEDRVERSGQAMRELEATQSQAKASMAALAAEARGPLLKAFSQQQSTMAQINNAFQANRKEIAALGAEMGRVGVPTREMVETYNKLLTASNNISGEYAQQKAALAALRAALRAGVTDVDQLNALYVRFAATLKGSASALDRVRAIQHAAAQANKALADSASRAASAADKIAQGNQRSANTARQAATATDKFSQAIRKFYGESRTAMSWTQRLRGEVLALIASYAGFYGAISALGGVIDAYQTLEAATSRLNVVMGGDQTKTGEELDFIRRTAERLGIEFGALAQEYSKFAVATEGTNLEGANTRKIFVAVAEAARVNKVSMEEMAGTFVALTQIVSKGAVQMEEVRQQLGDRLPGALQLMADGLGVTTAELIKMMEQGQVSSDALIGFADELTRKFGPQLAGSLNTVSANMGFLQNTVTATNLAFAENGFIDAYNDLLVQLNETMRSSDFQGFVARVSAGVGSLIDLLTTLIENFRLVSTVMAGIITIRLVPFLFGLGSAFMAATFQARLAHASMLAVQAGMASNIPVATAAAGAVGRLTIAMKALTSSTGIGLLLSAAAAAFAFWSTGADAASESMEAHRKVVDRVKNAYDAAGGANKAWASTIEKGTITEARIALEKSLKARDEAIDALASASGGGMFDVVGRIQTALSGAARAQVDSLRNLISEFRAGEIEANDFKEAVSGIAEAAENDTVREMAEAILEGSDSAIEFSKQSKELEAVLRVLNGTASQADMVLLGLADAADKVGEAFGTEQLDAYNAALREMAEFIPELKAQMDTLKDVDSINAAYDAAVAAARGSVDSNLLIANATRQRDQALTAVMDEESKTLFEQIAKNTGVTHDMFQHMFKEENFRSKAYNDLAGTPRESEGTWTVGYGSTRLGGRAVRPGDTVTQQQAMTQAVQDMATLIAQIQGSLTGTVSEKQLIALVSYGYNAGFGGLKKTGALDAINRGDYDAAGKALGGGVTTSKGMHLEGLKNRRGREAELFAEGMNDPAVVQALVEAERERLETAEDFRKELAAQAEDQQFLIDIAAQDLIQREQAKALREAELAAKEAGVTLSEAEIQGIKDRTAAQYAEQAQEEAAKKVKEDRAKVEQVVNDLLAQRTELEAQLAIYTEQGNTEMMEQTRVEMLAINEQLLAAIENARAMNNELGGEGAAARNAALQTTALEAQNLAASAGNVTGAWQQVGQMFASGLTNAFMRFSQAVAEGENVADAARDAFLQFASDFLIKIAEMIIQQAILNALSAVFGGGFGGGGGGILGGIFPTGHTGGVVGSKRIGAGNGTRQVSASLFAAAPRFHEGGFPGLRPGEVPAILQEGEEVLSKSSARNALNGGATGGGAGAGTPQDVKIVNAIDGASFLEQALSSRVGEKVFMNYVRANSSSIKNALGT